MTSRPDYTAAYLAAIGAGKLCEEVRRLEPWCHYSKISELPNLLGEIVRVIDCHGDLSACKFELKQAGLYFEWMDANGLNPSILLSCPQFDQLSKRCLFCPEKGRESPLPDVSGWPGLWEFHHGKRSN